MNVALLAFLTVLNAPEMPQLAQSHFETVVVCTQLAASKDARQALAIASEIFATAEIRIDWRARLSNCPADAIKITLRFHAPVTDHPGALAYALPFEGTHICILYDRIERRGYALLPYLLAHVMAHEIAHMVERVPYHSPEGVMKAVWSWKDFARMRNGNLQFTSADIEWLRLGLAARRARFQRHSRYAKYAGDAIADHAFGLEGKSPEAR